MAAPPENEPTFRELMEQTGACDAGNERRHPPTRLPVAPRRMARRSDKTSLAIRKTKDEFMRGGLQYREMRRLKRGKLHAGNDEQIDLHGLKRIDAHAALRGFLDRCLHRGTRCAIVICGKGHHSPHSKPVLKLLIRSWLEDDKNVLAYCPALPEDGGSGALYVLLGRQRRNSPRRR